MFGYLQALFDTSDFPERWNCGNWSELHGWTHILADIGVGLAYTAIPFSLARFWWLKRDELEFPKILWLFVAFIFSCGSTHFIEAAIFYHPIYRVSAIMKVVTALVSWATVIAIYRAAPKALELPGLRRANLLLEERMEDLRESRQALEKSNRDLAAFTEVVSNNLRNPISGVLFLSELALESAAAEKASDMTDQLGLIAARLRELDRYVAELHAGAMVHDETSA